MGVNRPGLLWGLAVFAGALLAGFTAHAADPIVFDRGVKVDELSPIINLKSASALFTIRPEEPLPPDDGDGDNGDGGDGGDGDTGGETPPVVKVVLPQLVPGTRDGKANLMPTWFPDRSRIAYVSNRSSENRGQIWTVDPVTGQHAQVTANEGNNLWPAVSPDAELVAYVSTANLEDLPEEPLPGEEPPEDDGRLALPANLELYVATLDGTEEPRRLTENEFEESWPVFSYDGQTIYFVSMAGDPAEPTIYSIPLDGEPGDELPVFGPDQETPLLGTFLTVLGDSLGDTLVFNDPAGLYRFYDTFTYTLATAASNYVNPHINQDGTEVVHAPGGNLYTVNLADGSAPQALLLTGDVTFSQWRAPVGADTLPGLRIDQPNGGQIWPHGATKNIEWESTGDLAGAVRLDLSHEGVAPVPIVASTENDGLYEWTIPASIEPATDYVVTVTLLSDPSLFDSSDAPFRITVPEGCPKPGKLLNLRATDGTLPDRVELTWSGDYRATEYLVFRNRINSFSSATLIGTSEEHRYEDITAVGIAPNTGCYGPPEIRTEYYYWVRAVNDCGMGPLSAPETGYRGRPEDIALSAGGDTLVLLGVALALGAAGLTRRRRCT